MNLLQRIKKTFAVPKKQDPLSVLIKVKQDNLQQGAPDLRRKNPNDWLQVRTAYDDPEQPQNDQIQDLYQDALLDAHLQAVQQKRLLALQNKEFVLRRANGEIDEEKSTWLQQLWFRAAVGWAIESCFFGYSLIWITEADPAAGRLQLELVDRRRVVPQRGLLRLAPDTDEGALPYESYPEALLFACLGRPKGLLEIASLMTIAKRHSLANWSEFEQIFGVPLRILRLPNMQSEQVHEAEQWLKDMGSAAYGIFPTAAEIDIKESQTTDAHEVFSEKIALLNSEISKLYLGQTMTTDEGSSLSQSRTHADTEQQVLQGDQALVLGWLNNTLLPAMRAHGFSLAEGERIDLPEAIDPKQRLEQDSVLLNAGVRLSKKYLESTYDVEIDETSAPTEEQARNVLLTLKKKVKPTARS